MKTKKLARLVGVVGLLAMVSSCATEGQSSNTGADPVLGTQKQAIDSGDLLAILGRDGWAGPNKDPNFDFMVSVNGHAKGQAANVKGICAGNLISKRVVVTAKHCINNMDSITVNAPFVNSTWLTPTATFTHASPRIDVGIIILPATGIPARKFAVVPTTAQFNAMNGFWLSGRIAGGVPLTNDMAGSNGSGKIFPSVDYGPFLPGSVDEYLVEHYRKGEKGDSGGACYSYQIAGVDGSVLFGINTLLFQRSTDWHHICTRLDVIKSWLDQIVATNAVVASSSTFYTQYPDYKTQFSVYADIWRLVQ